MWPFKFDDRPATAGMRPFVRPKVLDANLLENNRNTRQISSVYLGGNLIARHCSPGRKTDGSQ